MTDDTKITGNASDDGTAASAETPAPPSRGKKIPEWMTPDEVARLEAAVGRVLEGDVTFAYAAEIAADIATAELARRMTDAGEPDAEVRAALLADSINGAEIIMATMGAPEPDADPVADADDADVTVLEAPADDEPDGDRPDNVVDFTDAPNAERVTGDVVSFNPFDEDEAPTKQKRLTRQSAKRHREREDQGWIFTLYRTTDDDGNAQTAHVRRVTLNDRATLGSLPRQLQEEVIRLSNERSDRRKDTNEVRRALRALGQTETVADAYVIAGFLDPRVYASEADAEKHDGVYVKDIDVADRFRYMNACDGATEEAAAALKPFPA